MQHKHTPHDAQQSGGISIRNNDAFSLVELMITVAIIGILAVIASTQFRTFKLRAMRSEAVTFGKHAVHLANAWEENEGSTVSVASAIHGSLIMQRDQTNGSCESDIGSVIGIAASSCTRMRYSYGFNATGNPSDRGSFAVEASSRFPHPCHGTATPTDYGADYVAFGSCGKTCVAVDGFNNDCQNLFQVREAGREKVICYEPHICSTSW